MQVVPVINGDTDPIARQRWQWGENIKDLLEIWAMSRKALIAELEEAYGIDVSPQAVSQWITGTTAPSPLAQAAIADVFGVPHHVMFPPIAVHRATPRTWRP